MSCSPRPCACRRCQATARVHAACLHTQYTPQCARVRCVHASMHTLMVTLTHFVVDMSGMARISCVSANVWLAAILFGGDWWHMRAALSFGFEEAGEARQGRVQDTNITNTTSCDECAQSRTIVYAVLGVSFNVRFGMDGRFPARTAPELCSGRASWREQTRQRHLFTVGPYTQ